MENRKILVLVSGMSPQIITETLYALITQDQPWVPNEVHLITTEQGRSNAVGKLLNEKTEVFKRLLNDYGVIRIIKFDQSTIHIIDRHGEPLNDLRTPEENQAAADFISEKIRQFTQDPNTELHVSLAGGRKTMGFYAGYALSLFGRAQDKLSHVLVSERYESSDFYYPAPESDRDWIETRDGKTLDTHKAMVWLAEIPYVRMRNGLPEKLLAGGSSFSDTIKIARYVTEQPHLVLNPKNLTARLHDQSAKLSPAHMAMLLWAYEAQPITTLVDGEQQKEYSHAYFAIAERYDIDLRDNSQEKLGKGMTKEFMQHTASRLNTTFKRAFGTELAELCKLAAKKIGRRRTYALPGNLIITVEKG
jgi:CRISPR-associated protein (TIGR02584 family)